MNCDHRGKDLFTWCPEPRVVCCIVFFSHVIPGHTCSHRYKIPNSTLILSPCISVSVTPTAPAELHAPSCLFLPSFAQFYLLYSHIRHLCASTCFSSQGHCPHWSRPLLSYNSADKERKKTMVCTVFKLIGGRWSFCIGFLSAHKPLFTAWGKACHS